MSHNQQPSNTPPELSVVILCYKAEELAREFVAQISKELEDANINYELILVGNYQPGTDDKTPDIVRQLAASDPRFRSVIKEKEGMMGWDMRSGLEAAAGKNIAIIDGDGQMPSSDVVKVYRLLQVGNYDLVKTFRARRFDGFYRRTISWWYNLFFKMLFRSTARFRDINSKPKVITKEAYKKLDLVSSDWFTDAEIMIEALKNKLRIGEVSTDFYENERRASFVKFSTIFEFVKNLFYYRFIKNKK